MATQTNNPEITRIAVAAISAYRLLVQDANGKVQHAAVSATRKHLGVSQEPAAIGDLVRVRLPSAGTMKVAADGIIARDAVVYYGATGYCSATSAGSTRIGIALEAAAAAGDVIEIMPD
jgi:glycine cleavage system H lipoate-binding protein